MEDPIETSELLAFAKTVSAKSFSRAAAELGVPRATLSRRLARLEKRLGTRLLRRTTRSLRLTDAGETLFRHAAIVLDAVRQAEASVSQSDARVRGELRVSVPPGLGEDFTRFIAGFIAQHPDVRMTVHASSRRVDLMREGYDVALRGGLLTEPGLMVRTLMHTPVIAVASPAYLKRHGVPQSRRDLRHHRCLVGLGPGELPETHWQLAGRGTHHVTGIFATNELELRCGLALAGHGITMLPLPLVQTHLARKRLLQVLPETLRLETVFAVVFVERELIPPQVRAFVDAVIAWAPSYDIQRLGLKNGIRRLPRRRA